MGRNFKIIGIFLLLLGMLPPVEVFSWTPPIHSHQLWVPYLKKSCDIEWSQKKHQFESDLHSYEFRGRFKQKYCIVEQEDGKCYEENAYYRYIEFNVKSSYCPSNGTVTEDTIVGIPGGNTIRHTYQCSDPGTNCYVSPKKINKSGSGIPYDPWLKEPDSLEWAAWNIRLENHQAVLQKYRELRHFPVNVLFSTCAYSNAERAALREESVKEGTCAPEMAHQAPNMDLGISVMGQTFNNGHFSAPGDANMLLTVDCLPSTMQDQLENLFVFNLQQKKWDNGIYGYFWDDIVGEKTVAMQPIEGTKKGVGTIIFGLSEPGTYRVRAKSQLVFRKFEEGREEHYMITSPYTPWATFTAGDLKIEKIKADVAQDHAQAQAGSGLTTLATGSVKAQLPDLVVDAFEAQRSDQGFSPRWHVRNIGNKGAPATDLLICCECSGPGECPQAFGSPIGDGSGRLCALLPIDEEFFPKPEGAPGAPGGGGWFGPGGPLPAPPAGSRYRLSAKVDSKTAIDEGNEANNSLSSTFPIMAIAGQAQGAMQSAAIDAPDLTADFQIESTVSGQYALSFKIRNQGTQPSAETGFTVACEKVGGGDCPTWFNGVYALRSLTPSPDDTYEVISGSPVLLPPPGVRFKLTAKLDPEEKVAEGPGESNNTVVGFFPAMMQSQQAEGILHGAVTQGQAGETMQRPDLKGSLKTVMEQEALESKRGSVGALSAAGKKATQSAGGAAGLKGKLQESGAAAAMAKLKVQRLWTVPAAPKAGEPFALHIAVANQGAADSGASELFQVGCTKLGGGPCPAMGASPRLRQAMAVKGTQSIKLEDLRWEAGQYRLTVNPASAPEGKLALTITVGPGLAKSAAVAGREAVGQAGQAVSSPGVGAAAAGAGKAAKRIRP